MRSALSLLFSRLNNSSSLSCFSYVLFPSFFNSFISLFWTNSSNFLLLVRGPKWNTVLEVESHQCCDSFGHTTSEAGQAAISLLGLISIPLAHIQLAISQHPQLLSPGQVSSQLFPKSITPNEVVVTQVQHPAFIHAEYHPIRCSPWN